MENLMYLAGLKNEIGREEVEEAIASVGLDPGDKRVYGKYSMGMKQRLVLADCDRLVEDLVLAPHIIKVRPLDTLEYVGGRGRQPVEIREVVQGDGPGAGEQIYLVSNMWSLSFQEEIRTIERGFVNIMEVGEDYLVFCLDPLEGTGDRLPIYPLYMSEDAGLIAPIFALQNRENKIGDTWRETTYTPYREVRDNELISPTRRHLLLCRKQKGLPKTHLRYFGGFYMDLFSPAAFA